MPKVLPLTKRLKGRISKFGLTSKWQKQVKLLEKDLTHPGLNVEILEPKQYKIYSFRIDRKYRATFFYRQEKNAIEIIAITAHYH